MKFSGSPVVRTPPHFHGKGLGSILGWKLSSHKPQSTTTTKKNRLSKFKLETTQPSHFRVQAKILIKGARVFYMINPPLISITQVIPLAFHSVLATADFSSWSMPVLLASGPWHRLPRIFLHPHPALCSSLHPPPFRVKSKVNFLMRSFLATLSKKWNLLPTPMPKLYTFLFLLFPLYTYQHMT